MNGSIKFDYGCSPLEIRKKKKGMSRQTYDILK